MTFIRRVSDNDKALCSDIHKVSPIIGSMSHCFKYDTQKLESTTKPSFTPIAHIDLWQVGGHGLNTKVALPGPRISPRCTPSIARPEILHHLGFELAKFRTNNSKGIPNLESRLTPIAENSSFCVSEGPAQVQRMKVWTMESRKQRL